MKDTVPEGHQPPHDSGWITVPLETEEGVQRALTLLRGNYESGPVRLTIS